MPLLLKSAGNIFSSMKITETCTSMQRTNAFPSRRLCKKKHHESEICDSSPPGQDPIKFFARIWADLIDFRQTESGGSSLVEDLIAGELDHGVES